MGAGVRRPFMATVGVLSILIALIPLKRGEAWAWYAVLVFVFCGVLNAFLDCVEIGIWQTFITFALLQLLGLALATRSFLPTK